MCFYFLSPPPLFEPGDGEKAPWTRSAGSRAASLRIRRPSYTYPNFDPFATFVHKRRSNFDPGFVEKVTVSEAAQILNKRLCLRSNRFEATGHNKIINLFICIPVHKVICDKVYVIFLYKSSRPFSLHLGIFDKISFWVTQKEKKKRLFQAGKNKLISLVATEEKDTVLRERWYRIA